MQLPPGQASTEMRSAYAPTARTTSDGANRYAVVVDSLPTIIYEYSWETKRTTWVSDNVERLTGWTPEALASDARPWEELVHPDDRDATIAALRAGLASGRFRAEYRLRHAGGSYRWYRDHGSVLAGSEGPLIRGVMIDISEQRMLEDRERAFADLLIGVAGSLELDQVLQRIADVAVRLLSADAATVRLPCEDHALEMRAESGLTCTAPVRVSLDDGGAVSVRAFRSGRIERLIDYAGSGTPYASMVLGPPLGPVIAIPVLVDEAPAAVLTVCRIRGRDDFDARAIADAGLLATQAAHAIANARHYEETRSASAAKTRFLSTMSHELRTPLNAVEGFLSLLDMELAGSLSPQQREYVARARRAGQHLLRIIDDVLDLSRVERGRVHVRRRPLRLADPLLQAIEVVRAQLRPAVTLRLEPLPDDFTAVGDADRVRQILINLIGNAAKFTSRGEIAVRPVSDDATIGLAVCDTGPGIAPEHLEHIFEPFYQVDGSLARATAGAGLGLAVSRQLALAMGGDLRVESAVGEGSTFALVLPRAG